MFSWGGNPGVGSLHRLRDAVENGWPRPLALEEHSHAAMANAYEAGAAEPAGGDLSRLSGRTAHVREPQHPSRSRVHSLASCWPLFRRIRPDVTVVHAQQADAEGNVLIEGDLGVQKEAVLAARRAIVDRGRSRSCI